MSQLPVIRVHADRGSNPLWIPGDYWGTPGEDLNPATAELPIPEELGDAIDAWQEQYDKKHGRFALRPEPVDDSFAESGRILAVCLARELEGRWAIEYHHPVRLVDEDITGTLDIKTLRVRAVRGESSPVWTDSPEWEAADWDPNPPLSSLPISAALSAELSAWNEQAPDDEASEEQEAAFEERGHDLAARLARELAGKYRVVYFDADLSVTARG